MMRWLIAGLLAAPVAALAAELPIFDAHIHYSHDAWEVLPPKEAIAIRRFGMQALLPVVARARNQRPLHSRLAQDRDRLLRRQDFPRIVRIVQVRVEDRQFLGAHRKRKEQHGRKDSDRDGHARHHTFAKRRERQAPSIVDFDRSIWGDPMKRSLLAACAVLSLATGCASTAETPTANQSRDEGVYVTGSRIPARNSGQAVNRISKEEWENSMRGQQVNPAGR